MELFAVILFTVNLIGFVVGSCAIIFDITFNFRYTHYVAPVVRASVCVVLISIVIGAITLFLL